MGGVLTDRVIIQRLTDFRWTAISSTVEHTRTTNIARILVALRECLDELKKYYSSLPNADIPRLCPDEPHPRFYPYPTSYISDGSDGRVVKFRYIGPVEEGEVTCVTFLAKIVNGDKAKKVVVKFVAQYGMDVHRYLADRGFAPQLYYFGRLDGTKEHTASGMQMVDMEYIDSKTTAPSDAYDKIAKILTALHPKGYVFGDLRQPNILFDKTDKAFLVDFNWCGQYNMSMDMEFLGIPPDVEQCIKDELKSASYVDKEDVEYVRYPLAIS
jgi:hypothetical protein